jgi:hypothetical protein
LPAPPACGMAPALGGGLGPHRADGPLGRGEATPDVEADPDDLTRLRLIGALEEVLGGV